MTPADIEGGAGVGPGGETLCGAEEEGCRLDQRDRRRYRGGGYGAHVGAGAGGLLGPFALFSRARLEIAKAGGFPAAHRVTPSR